MDTSILHAATEHFAGYWSEVTTGDLGLPVSLTDGDDVGDLYLATLAAYRQTTLVLAGAAPALASVTTSDRALLPGLANLFGGGLEDGYRTAAAAMLAAFQHDGAPGSLALHEGHSGSQVEQVYGSMVTVTQRDTALLAHALGGVSGTWA